MFNIMEIVLTLIKTKPKEFKLEFTLLGVEYLYKIKFSTYKLAKLLFYHNSAFFYPNIKLN